MRKTTDPKPRIKISIRLFITVVLVALGSWLFNYNRLQKPIHYQTYTFSADEAKRLKLFPRALYAHGMQAWLQNNSSKAGRFFRQAVLQDVFFIDAWLRLSQTEAAEGRRETAENILRFTNGLTENIFRWKWPQILLARELGMEEILYRNINDLLSHQKLQQDALQLLYSHLGGDVKAVMGALEADHLLLFLSWLMQWGKTEDSLVVWQKMIEKGNPGAQTGLRYAHFLLDKKHVSEAKVIWRQYGGVDGMTNGGFENQITRSGFDWRFGSDKEGNWTIKRVDREAYEGRYALRISFNGRKNVSFQDAFQIVPVIPLKRYRLIYAWKSQGISTDQGPFVEIVGYDRGGFYQSGPMILETRGWQEQTIGFRPPEGCQAVIVRVRRRPSRRFGSKIQGILWLDDFRLEALSTEVDQTSLPVLSSAR